MRVDRLLIAAVRNCGGGAIHAAVQMTAAYEFAVARYNHRNCKPEQKDALIEEIRAFEAQLYALGRRR